MTGYLLYDTEGICRNKWFANELIKYAKLHDISLELIIVDKNLDFCCPEMPDFVITRVISPQINDYFEKVFINDQIVKIVLPLSYNPETGIIRLRRVTASNDVIISTISCKRPVSNDIISVDFFGDYYTDTIISKDFYKGIKLSVTLDNLKTEILNPVIFP